MRFFVPGIDTPEQTEGIYEALKSKAEYIALRVTDKRIYSILYKRRGKLYNMTVGKPNVKGETVIGVFESSVFYLVFTPNRGVIRGDPLLIGKEETLSVEEFE